MTITITCPHTGQTFTHDMPSRGEARRLALRMRRGGYFATYGWAS